MSFCFSRFGESAIISLSRFSMSLTFISAPSSSSQILGLGSGLYPKVLGHCGHAWIIFFFVDV